MVRNTNEDGEVRSDAITESTMIVSDSDYPAPRAPAPGPVAHAAQGHAPEASEDDELDDDDFDSVDEEDEPEDEQGDGDGDGDSDGDSGEGGEGGAPDDEGGEEGNKGGEGEGAGGEGDEGESAGGEGDEGESAGGEGDEGGEGMIDPRAGHDDQGHDHISAGHDGGTAHGHGVETIGGDAASVIAESVHRFSPDLGPPTPSSSVIWIPSHEAQSPAAAALEMTVDARPRSPNPAHPVSSAAREAHDMSMAGIACVSAFVAAPTIANAPVAGPSQPATFAVGGTSAPRARSVSSPGVSSSPPFRAIPSAGTMRRYGLDSFFGQPLPEAYRPQTPPQRNQPPAGPPPRKRVKRNETRRSVPAKQYISKPRKQPTGTL
ncbi:hypothetical protein OC835_003410 [Tilletia horrida]|nr:hypothetical protein OC835_003410 [Tilletia horrida]